MINQYSIKVYSAIKCALMYSVTLHNNADANKLKINTINCKINNKRIIIKNNIISNEKSITTTVERRHIVVAKTTIEKHKTIETVV